MKDKNVQRIQYLFIETHTRQLNVLLFQYE